MEEFRHRCHIRKRRFARRPSTSVQPSSCWNILCLGRIGSGFRSHLVSACRFGLWKQCLGDERRAGRLHGRSWTRKLRGESIRRPHHAAATHLCDSGTYRCRRRHFAFAAAATTAINRCARPRRPREPPRGLELCPVCQRVCPPAHSNNGNGHDAPRARRNTGAPRAVVRTRARLALWVEYVRCRLGCARRRVVLRRASWNHGHRVRCWSTEPCRGVLRWRACRWGGGGGG